MSPEQHQSKAERIERAMTKLTQADYELVIEATMLAGTHWLNVAMHRSLLTASGEDVMHAEYLSGALRLKASLVMPGLVQALDEIEQLRPLHVRGDAPDGEAAGKRCRALLEVLRSGAKAARPFK